MPQQFDVCRTARGILVVVIQSDLIDIILTRTVVPLLPAGAAGRPMRVLNPEITFGDERFVLMPQLVATLSVGELGPPIGSIAHMRDTLIRAVDMLLSGAAALRAAAPPAAGRGRGRPCQPRRG